MRRKADEREHKPSVGLLYEDGTIERHYLDCSEDKFVEQEAFEGLHNDWDFSGFIEELSNLNEATVDFREAVVRFLDKGNVRQEVKDIVMQSLEARK